MIRRHYTTIGAAPAPLPADWDRAEAIRGLMESGVLRAEEKPATLARLAEDHHAAARNARGYIAHYETQLVEADLPVARANLTRWIGEQRALLAYHASKYLRWRRAERRANRHVDELLAAKAAADRDLPCSPNSTLDRPSHFAAGGRS